MDPISVIFASHLELVSFNVTHKMTDLLGTEIQSVVVEHQNIQVPYSYQLWRIVPKSVCNTYNLNIEEFSRCTLAAKSLFNETCLYLQKGEKEHWKYTKMKNMYCNASMTFKPTIANIRRASVKTPLQLARTECNIATAELMGNHNSKTQKKKESSCAKYQNLKQQSKNN